MSGGALSATHGGAWHRVSDSIAATCHADSWQIEPLPAQADTAPLNLLDANRRSMFVPQSCTVGANETSSHQAFELHSLILSQLSNENHKNIM